MKLCLVLHNIRSTYNVGAILRTAEGLGVREVVYSGYTPRYADAKLLPHLREKLNRQIAKAALGAEEILAQQSVGEIAGWLEEKRREGWTVVGLENNLSGEELGRRVTMSGTRAKTRLDDRSKLVLVLGEEVGGIPPEIREWMDYFLEIPMRGQKESFNVSVAAGMAMWWLMDESHEKDPE